MSGEWSSASLSASVKSRRKQAVNGSIVDRGSKAEVKSATLETQKIPLEVARMLEDLVVPAKILNSSQDDPMLAVGYDGEAWLVKIRTEGALDAYEDSKIRLYCGKFYGGRLDCEVYAKPVKQWARVTCMPEESSDSSTSSISSEDSVVIRTPRSPGGRCVPSPVKTKETTNFRVSREVVREISNGLSPTKSSRNMSFHSKSVDEHWLSGYESLQKKDKPRSPKKISSCV